MSGIITVLFASMFASGFAKHQFSPEAAMFCASARSDRVKTKVFLTAQRKKDPGLAGTDMQTQLERLRVSLPICQIQGAFALKQAATLCDMVGSL